MATSTSMSRRSFVATAAATAATGIALGTTTANADEAKTEGATSGDVLECDVLVCGLGAAGATAAVAAARGGAKVIAIETADDITGAGGTSHCTAPAMFGSKAQNEANSDVPVTEQDAFEYIYPLTHYQENAPLLREMIRCSAVVIDEMVAAGFPFLFANTTVDADAAFKNKCGCIYMSGGAERGALWEAMWDEAGVDYRYGTTAESAILADDGTLAGIHCTTADGDLDIHAKRVILCCGGFISNTEMVKQYYAGADIVSCGMPADKGDGTNIALSLGAQMGKNFSTSVNEFGGSNLKAIPQTARGAEDPCNSALRLQILGLPAFDKHGNRFIDEGIMNGHVMYSGEPLLRNSTYYILADQAFIDRIKSEPYGNFIDTSEPTNVANFLVDLELTDMEEAVDEAVEQGWAAKGTLAEVAEAFGLENLEASVAKYNEYCEAGLDEQFYKTPEYLIPLTQEPYYLIEYNPSGYLTLGGIKCDAGCRALDANNDIVPNLFVAGTDADLWSVPYALGGSAHGFSLSSGWLAGETAAKEIAEA